jgi:Flp pilus assembly protein TadD
MTRRFVPVLTLLLGFGLGGAAVLMAQSPTDNPPSDKPPAAAPAEDFSGDQKAVADRLLTKALKLAGKGSWERIAVGRVRYLSGDKAAGEALFDSVRSVKPEASDYIRIGQVYALAGEWDKAKGMLDKAVTMKPRHEGFLTEAGAWHLLSGDRAGGEALFRQAWSVDPNDFWDHVVAAAAYHGQQPF